MLLRELFYYEKEEYFLTWACIGFISGIIIYLVYPTLIGFIFIMSISSIFYFFYRDLRMRIFLISIVLGFFRIFVQVEFITSSKIKPIVGQIELEGYVEEVRGDRYLISVKTLRDSSTIYYKTKAKLLLSCLEKIDNNSYIACEAEIYPIQAPIAVKAPDHRLKYFFEGIIASGKINYIKNKFKIKQNIIKDLLEKNIEDKFSSLEANFIRAILFGESPLNDQDWINEKKLFQRLGISHLLAISGLHFSLFSTIFYLIARWLIGPLIIPSFMSMQNFALFFSLIGIIYYVNLANPSWSVIRSIIMFLIPIFLLFSSRKINLYKNCIISLLIMSFIWPYSIADPGLQLSFLAVLSLSIFRGNLLTSTGRILFITAPFLLYWFKYVSLQPFIASIFCIPIFSFLVMPLTTICSITCFPNLLSFLLSKSISLFFYSIHILQNLFIVEVKLFVSNFGLAAWIISIFLWLLIKNKTIILVGFTCFLFSLRPFPKSAILINKSCKEALIIDNETIYSKDLESSYSKICSEIFFIKKYEKILDGEKKYIWKEFELLFEKNGRLREIKYNGRTVLKAFDIISRKSPCIINLNTMEAEFIDGSRLKL